MMTTPLDKLVALAAQSIARVSSPQWEREMARIIAQSHTAAYMAAIAERTGVQPRGLSREERAEVKRAVEAQLNYLRGFVQARQGMSEAAIAARSSLYAGSIKTTYYAARWGAWDVPQGLIPGNQQCLGRCLCVISITDHGDGTGTLTRTMGGTEHHCSECPPLMGDHPVKRRVA